MDKDFIHWHALKEQLDGRERLRTFEEREIWWCSIGTNVGDEQDGKNQYFNRPVLVLRKYNPRLFLGIPLSSKVKRHNPYYHHFIFKGVEQSAILMQMRVWSAKRLSHLMGKLSKEEFLRLRSAVLDSI